MLLVLTNVQHIFPNLLLSISEIPEIPIEEFLFIHTLNIEHELQHETQFVKLFCSRILECCTDCCDREHILLHRDDDRRHIYTSWCDIFCTFLRSYGKQGGYLRTKYRKSNQKRILISYEMSEALLPSNCIMYCTRIQKYHVTKTLEWNLSTIHTTSHSIHCKYAPLFAMTELFVAVLR